MFPVDGTSRDGLSTDLYQLTMAAAYHESGMADEATATFELFTRSFPGNRGYLVAGGIGSALAYLEDLTFHDDEIAWLREQEVFDAVGDSFFDALRSFRFTGTVRAVPEGDLVFPYEPILTVTAPILEAQIVETHLLSVVNFETLIASKAARIVDAAGDDASVVDFGTRRAHGPEAGLRAARASYVGGAIGTSNVLAGFDLDIPIYGTFAHSWVMAHEDEMASFRRYQASFPEATILLVDTYDTLGAVRAAAASDLDFQGIRLDSGDLGELARASRRILDEAGREDVRIVVSSEMDEWAIRDLLGSGAPIDVFGVGTRLVTSRDAPALGGVYKLMEVRRDGDRRFTVKISPEKKNYPGRKQVWRREDAGGHPVGDVVALDEEEGREGRPVLREVMRDGRRVDDPPALEAIRARALERVGSLPAGVRDLDDPEPYPVRMSERLEEVAEEERRRRVERTAAG